MYTLEINKGAATIELGRKVNGEFPVLSCSLVTDGLALVISPRGCADSVTNLDEDSDWAQCFGLSCRVSVDGCVIGTTSMRAKDVDLLHAALTKVKFVARDPGDI